MTGDVRYLDVEDLLHIAELEHLGPVRDVGLLESAAARPRASVLGRPAYATLELQAAALLESLVRNHALVDGNKRLGWLATVAFLWLNGFRLLADEDEAYDVVIGIAEGGGDLDDLARRIETWVWPLGES